MMHVILEKSGDYLQRRTNLSIFAAKTNTQHEHLQKNHEMDEDSDSRSFLRLCRHELDHLSTGQGKADHLVFGRQCDGSENRLHVMASLHPQQIRLCL